MPELFCMSYLRWNLYVASMALCQNFSDTKNIKNHNFGCFYWTTGPTNLLGSTNIPNWDPIFLGFFLPATATALQGGHNSPSPVSWPSSCHKNFMVQKSVPTLRFRSRNLSWTFRTGAAAAVQKTRRSNRKMIYPLVN